MKWNNASNDWHTLKAENDLKVGGKFLYRMEAKDSSSGSDFAGTYKKIKTNELIVYSLTDGREVDNFDPNLHYKIILKRTPVRVDPFFFHYVCQMCLSFTLTTSMFSKRNH